MALKKKSRWFPKTFSNTKIPPEMLSASCLSFNMSNQALRRYKVSFSFFLSFLTYKNFRTSYLENTKLIWRNQPPTHKIKATFCHISFQFFLHYVTLNGYIELKTHVLDNKLINQGIVPNIKLCTWSVCITQTHYSSTSALISV